MEAELPAHLRPAVPLTALAGDTHRLSGRSGWTRVLVGALRSRTFRCLVTLRACQATRGRIARALVHPLFRLCHRLACARAAIDLPWQTTMAPGLAIMHGWGLVVNGGARIGRNVTLFQGVTLGRRDRISRDGTREIGYPIIEDEVWIGPHAVIVGGITIGRGSRIAAGAFVTEDVPAGSVVVGNPAAIARSNCAPDVVNRVA